MGFLRKPRDWWRGNNDPEERAKAAQLREDIETLRVGRPTSNANITQRGKESTGRY